MQGLTRADQSKVSRSEDTHSIEDMVLCPPIKKIWIGRRTAVAGGGNHRPNSYQAVSGGKGQRLQHDGIYDAEDRCRHSNSQRERQKSDESKPGRFAQLAQRISNVASNAVERQRGIGGRSTFLHHSGIAKADKSIATRFLR